MKLKIYLLVLMVLSFKLINAQTAYYYYNNEKIFIDIDKEYVVVNASVNLNFLQSYAANYISKTDFVESKVRNYVTPKDSAALSRVSLKNYYSEIRVTNSVKNSVQNYNNFVNALNQDANTIKVSPSFTYKGNKLGITNYFFVKLKSLSDESVLYNYAQTNNLEVIGSIPFMPEWHMVECTKTNQKNALEYANLFYESGLFDAAEPEFVYHGGSTGFLQSNVASENLPVNSVNDMFYTDQWGLNNSGQYGAEYVGIDIKAEQAWTITKGNNIKVAVYDDGFELNHPDLIQNVEGQGFNARTNATPSIHHSILNHATGLCRIYRGGSK